MPIYTLSNMPKSTPRLPPFLEIQNCLKRSESIKLQRALFVSYYGVEILKKTIIVEGKITTYENLFAQEENALIAKKKEYEELRNRHESLLKESKALQKELSSLMEEQLQPLNHEEEKKSHYGKIAVIIGVVLVVSAISLTVFAAFNAMWTLCAIGIAAAVISPNICALAYCSTL